MEGKIMKTTMILVRHGQTEWNRVERFRGRADVPLNETGLRQAVLTAERIACSWHPVAVYSSPLSRAQQTAQATARQFDLSVEVNEGLADIDYGKWQGLTPEEAWLSQDREFTVISRLKASAI
jgi:phosphoserine phosphatase